MGKEKHRWPDQKVREIIKAWVDRHEGDPKKAFPPYPKRGRKGPEIRKVRLRIKRQVGLMAQVSTGYAVLGNNHHIAIYRLPKGAVDYEVVSLLEASRRLGCRESVVRRERGDGAEFMMSLSPGDSLKLARNGEENIWIVKKIASNGQVTLWDHKDAVGQTTKYSPIVKTIANNGEKISVDPIGRIRPAND